MGKTTLLLNMTLNDIYANEGACFIDPHGDAVETLLDYIPSSRVDDVIYLNPADLEYPIGINPLGKVPSERRHLLVSGLLSIFRCCDGFSEVPSSNPSAPPDLSGSNPSSALDNEFTVYSSRYCDLANNLL